MSEIEDLYELALRDELGEIREGTDRVRDAVFHGEIAFALNVHCIIPDSPDKDGNIQYRLLIRDLNHDMTMYILTSLRDVITCEDEHTSIKRNGLGKELNALGIGHMSRWITKCKNGTYTLSIRNLSYHNCRIIAKILFEW